MALRSSLRTVSTIQDRTLYLRVKPAPSKLSERRAVLRVLKQIGPIDVFKKLYDDSSFISVTRDIATFWNIKRKTPLQFDYEDEQASKGSDPRVAPTSEPATNGQTFTVEAFSAPDYPHNVVVRKSPLYGPWPYQTEKSLTTSALSQVVPKDMASRGLVDWETGAQGEEPDARKAWRESPTHAANKRKATRKHRGVLDELANLVNGRDDEGR